MTTFKRYLLFQIPGWILAVILLFGFRGWLELPLWGATVLFALYVVKDFIFYPFLRTAYEPRGGTSLEQLIGNRGVVKQTLRPDGYVLVRGELWRARATSAEPALQAGSRVRVQDVEGRVLIVSPEPDASAVTGAETSSAS